MDWASVAPANTTAHTPTGKHSEANAWVSSALEPVGRFSRSIFPRRSHHG
jgi:hypothetical protein